MKYDNLVSLYRHSEKKQNNKKKFFLILTGILIVSAIVLFVLYNYLIFDTRKYISGNHFINEKTNIYLELIDDYLSIDTNNYNDDQFFNFHYYEDPKHSCYEIRQEGDDIYITQTRKAPIFNESYRGLYLTIPNGMTVNQLTIITGANLNIYKSDIKELNIDLQTKNEDKNYLLIDSSNIDVINVTANSNFALNSSTINQANLTLKCNSDNNKSYSDFQGNTITDILNIDTNYKYLNLYLINGKENYQIINNDKVIYDTSLPAYSIINIVNTTKSNLDIIFEE